MRRFINKLLRDFKTTGTARGGRRAPRAAALQVEGLEDRLVLSTASLNPSTGLLQVVASRGTFSQSSPGGPVVEHIRQITLEVDKVQTTKLDVLDNGALLGQFPIASVKAVTVRVAGIDAINVDDSNGMPFAANVNMTLFGEGNLNSLNVKGSRPFAPGALEGYTAGNGTTDGELDTLAGNAFRFSNAIESVSDSIQSDGILTDAFGSKVTLTGANGTQTLRGMSVGGAGDTFSFSHKKFVGLGLNSDSALATLNATTAAAGEQTFSVALHGNFETADIKATPSTVVTYVLAGGASLSNTSFVTLEANSGLVNIDGGSGTSVTVGRTVAPGQLVTSGIKANVSVAGVGVLTVDDSGNTTTQENVKVTESTISGLFGNSAVRLTYTPGALDIITGQLADTYTVVGSKSGASFSSDIQIISESKKSLSVTATVDAGSGLNLELTNVHPGQPVVPASLTIIALGGTFSHNPATVPIGLEDVTFPGGQLSEIGYDGFQTVTLINSIANRLATPA
jgi:hypothetical protein